MHKILRSVVVLVLFASTLILAVHAQLRLARTLTVDLRRRWETSAAVSSSMTPGRVRRGFRILRRQLGTPARTPKSTTAGPGRPSGTTRPPRTRYDVGKTKSTKDTERSTNPKVRG